MKKTFSCHWRWKIQRYDTDYIIFFNLVVSQIFQLDSKYLVSRLVEESELFINISKLTMFLVVSLGDFETGRY